MKTSRTRLQFLVLLAIPLTLVAVYRVTQAQPKPQRTPKDPATPDTASKPRLSEGGEEAYAEEYGAKSDNQGGSEEGRFGTAGGFSGTFGGEYGPAAGFADNQRLIQGTNIMISWSKENDELRGFSLKSGEWTNLKIEPQASLRPVLGRDVAVISIGNSVAAYSGITETWDVFQPTEPIKNPEAPNPIVGHNLAAVRVGDTMAAYSGTTGKWGVLKLSKDSKAQAVIASDTHVQTTDNDYLYTFAASKGKWTSPNDPKFRPARDLSGEYGTGYDPMISGPGPGIMPGSGMGRFKPAQFDQNSVNLARQFRGKGLDDAEARVKLSQAVANEFDQRQNSQKVEAKRLQEKLQQIQEAIERREALRQRIIQRRVDELLDPNVDWDSLSSSSDSGGTAGTPIGLPGPPHLPLGGTSGFPTNNEAR